LLAFRISDGKGECIFSGGDISTSLRPKRRYIFDGLRPLLACQGVRSGRARRRVLHSRRVEGRALALLERAIVRATTTPVHIHDIPFPYLTLPTDHPLFTTYLLWNEAALVKAFLLFNDAFEILLCQSLLHYEDPAAPSRGRGAIRSQKHFPASLWLVKTV
jgi:hypothetical protein